MKFISIKDLMNIFTTNREWFARILMIIIMIKLSRFLKCFLISLKISKNSSWMSFRSIMFIITKISENENINKTYKMIEMII